MVDVRISRLADLIVNYSASIMEGDEVHISASIEAVPLVKELYKAILYRGGYPVITSLYDESLIETFYRHAGAKQLSHLSKIEKYVMENIDVRIVILSPTHTKYLNTIDPERIKLRSAATRPLTEIFMKRSAEGSLKWVIAPYPTKALAQEAGMGISEYEEFVYRACMVDRKDPVKEWLKESIKLDKIARCLEKVHELHYVGEGVDLYVRVDGRKWMKSDGKHNMPGGEVFTAPIEDSVEGYIEFSYPAIWHGREVEGVKLTFKKGCVVEAKAVRGQEFLNKILEVDEGARRVGEIAFGLNYNINRFTKEILFDEKIGGTIHLALGAAYPETGGKNVSAIHWDMIKDMKRCKVYADGELIYEKGIFIEI